MNILHICITSPYTINATYQENFLPAIMVKLGHDVTIWTTCYSWEGNHWIDIGEEEKTLDNGVKLRRWKYKRIVNDFISSKMRFVSGFFEALNSESPDFIMLHDPQTAIVPELCKYLDLHPNTTMVVDSHSDCYNSATNLLSDILLHRILYRKWVREAYLYARTFYPLSPECEVFLINEYGLPKRKMTILPLGGNWLSDKEYYSVRKKRRNELGLDENTLVLVHSGKLTEGKKTDWVLEAFESIDAVNTVLIIVGSAEGSIKQSIMKYSAEDKRIKYLGWKSGTELQEYLCAGDIYVSPGTQSATVQIAMCCRCVPIVFPYKNYVSMLGKNGIYVSSKQELAEKVIGIISDCRSLDSKRLIISQIAKIGLDYCSQAEAILSGGRLRT